MPASPALTANRVALYCRTSSDDQAERGTIGTQVDFLHAFVALYSLDVAGEYLDDGVSGTVPLGDRPSGSRMLDAARRGQFGAVLVYRLDRLGRSIRTLLDAHDVLSADGVAIRSATEPFDTASPIGTFLFTLLGSLAELERETIRERMTLGRDRVARGGKWTNGSVPAGYDTDPDGRLVPSERPAAAGLSEADVVRSVYQHVASGATLIAECRRLEALGVPSVTRWPGRPDVVNRRWWPPHLHRILRNPLYRGEYTLASRHGPVTVPVPALVAPDLWHAAQAAMTQNRDLSRQPGARDYLLRGLARCGVCRRTYTGGPASKRLPDGSRRPYYRCSGAGSHSTAPDRPACPGRSVQADVLERLVWADVRAFLLHPEEALDDARAELDGRRHDEAGATSERERLAAIAAQKDDERDRAMLLFRRRLATIEETERVLADLDRETDQLRVMLAAILAQEAAVEAQATQLESTADLLGILAARVEAADAGDRQLQRELIGHLVREVTISTEPDGTTRRGNVRKRVRVLVRYAFAPGPECGRIPPARPNGMLQHKDASTLVLTREIALVR